MNNEEINQFFANNRGKVVAIDSIQNPNIIAIAETYDELLVKMLNQGDYIAYQIPTVQDFEVVRSFNE